MQARVAQIRQQLGVSRGKNIAFADFQIGSDSDELASRFIQTPQIQGTVNLFTERSPCASCSFVIEQFRYSFPNITLTVNIGIKAERSS